MTQTVQPKGKNESSHFFSKPQRSPLDHLQWVFATGATSRLKPVSVTATAETIGNMKKTERE